MKTILGSRRDQSLARLSIFLIIAALIAGMAGCDYNPPPSKDLEIQDWHDLDDVRDNMEGHHTLMNDLDSITAGYEELASPTANGGKGWQPIETYIRSIGSTGFGGTFDGQGHEIRDLFIDRPDENGVALFSMTMKHGVIKDLGVTNVTLTGADYVGSLVGSSTGSIINSYSSGDVTGDYRVGGLAGCSGGTVFNSYSSGNVIGSSSVGGLFGVNMGSVNNSHSMGIVIGVDDVGGLVGYSYYGTVSNSYSIGNVTGYSNVGGLVGLNGWEGIEGSTVGDCYSTGIITGNERVGGLVGKNHDGTVSNSYSSSSVIGDKDVGGLVGFNGYRNTVSNSYSSGSVIGDKDVGGLVGQNEGRGPGLKFRGNVSNSFWDTETSGQGTSDGGTGKNITEMQDITTFSLAGWNIIAVALNETNPAYIWNIVTGVTYPFLSWQP